MNTFEQDRARKLNRLKFLRWMNYTGMITWREDRYGCAQQLLRRLHPFSWVYVVAAVSVAVVLHGVVEVSKEFKTMIRDETVWW